MTTNAPLIHGRIDRYLARFDNGLAGMPTADRDDILLEIRTHILDSFSGTDDEAVLQRVLSSLGEPEQLAKHYRTEFLLAHAGRSFSPWTLLRTSWQWAKTGAKGLGVFFLAMLGYSAGLALTATVILKPFYGSRVGLWLGNRSLHFGMGNFQALSLPGPGGAQRELLGDWYIPVTTALAFAVVVGTTQALRSLMRRRIADRPRSVARVPVSQ
ncbi:MAG TPA: hypothetical protein VFI82_10220 [Terriglobales bacterium]|jgi:hypothetical protein|nr:hypothetical protein [Terriglobales bacterium]